MNPSSLNRAKAVLDRKTAKLVDELCTEIRQNTGHDISPDSMVNIAARVVKSRIEEDGTEFLSEDGLLPPQ